LFDWESEAFSGTEWKDFGISSGDPKDIASTDNVKVGEIINAILEKASEEQQQARLDDLSEYVSQNTGAEMPAEPKSVEDLVKTRVEEGPFEVKTYKGGGSVTYGKR
jgi:hypothetical protein